MTSFDRFGLPSSRGGRTAHSSVFREPPDRSRSSSLEFVRDHDLPYPIAEVSEPFLTNRSFLSFHAITNITQSDPVGLPHRNGRAEGARWQIDATSQKSRYDVFGSPFTVVFASPLKRARQGTPQEVCGIGQTFQGYDAQNMPRKYECTKFDQANLTGRFGSLREPFHNSLFRNKRRTAGA